VVTSCAVCGVRRVQGMHGPQKFQIHRIFGGDDRLPTAHTVSVVRGCRSVSRLPLTVSLACR
jgi:hypothetical protein